MNAKKTDLKELEGWYEKSGNQLMLLYGGMDCRKEQLIKEFCVGKKYFYYRCRQLSAQEQMQKMGEEIQNAFQIKLSRYSYDEFFNRVKSGDASKLVIVIDEAQYAIKRDPEFVKSILKLKMKRLYPGPVMIILASSSIVWAKQDAKDAFGDGFRRIDVLHKVEDLNFLEVVRTFPALSVSDCIRIYGSIGGVPGYMEAWNPEISYRENIYRLVLTEGGYLFHMAEQKISAELRELSVYNTILSAIAQGYNKLNDLYLKTGYSRAKISVYMKNLAAFYVVEKVIPFETGGWDNAKKGIYQIKDTYINFWYRFVYPHLSDLYCMKPDKFYDVYIREELDSYLNQCFLNVCKEYLVLLGRIGKTPVPIHKIGSWIGKTGNVDIVAQDKVRNTVVGLCNWEQKEVTVEMLTQMFSNMKKAKIKAVHFYVFSARGFSSEIKEIAKEDPRLELVDMNEL